MRAIFAIAVTLAILFIVGGAFANHGKPHGSCPDGHKWDHELQMCVPDPKG